MAQINLNVTPEFAQDLRRYMRARGFTEKSAAIRAAVREALERTGGARRPVAFSAWVGLARQTPLNPRPWFRDEDALWEGR